MKTLFILFFVCYIETFVVADNEALQTGPILIRSKKKNIDSIVHKKLNILNRRYLKIPEGQAGVDVKNIPTKKASDSNNAYTVFPPINLKGAKVKNLPDSPYFPLEKYADYKPRVKKVLPKVVFKSVIRRKRSAVKPKSNANVTKANTTAKKAVKRSDKNKNISKKDDKKGKVETDNKAKVDKDKKGPALKSGKARPPARSLAGKPKAAKKPKSGGKSKGRSKLRTRKSAAKRSRKQVRLGSKGKKKGRSNSRPKAVKPSRRLIASNDASVEIYPYVISIQKDRQHWCSGALLNPRMAITTANCLWKSDRISRMRIRACSRYTDRGGQEAKIQEVMKHPQWSIRSGPDHDLALIYLDRVINFLRNCIGVCYFHGSVAFVLSRDKGYLHTKFHIDSSKCCSVKRFSHVCHSVDLPNRAMYPAFEDAWITSWGAERRDGIYERPLTMQVYHASLLDRAVCNNITMRFGVPVTANFICLAQSGRRAPCTRDTGAPAVSDGVLWGVASWGIRKLCGTERFPAMFSYIASQSNMDFISYATTYLMSDQRLFPYPDRYPFEFTPEPPKTGTKATPVPIETQDFEPDRLVRF